MAHTCSSPPSTFRRTGACFASPPPRLVLTPSLSPAAAAAAPPRRAAAAAAPPRRSVAKVVCAMRPSAPKARTATLRTSLSSCQPASSTMPSAPSRATVHTSLGYRWMPSKPSELTLQFQTGHSLGTGTLHPNPGPLGSAHL